nr:PREDICTED: uncharacterized protein LOC105672125 [Linepithema humile]
MKRGVALCLLVVLCTVNATILNLPLTKVKNAKLSVEESTAKVNKLRNNYVQKTDFTIIQKWLKEIEKLEKYIERTLKTMDKEIGKIKDENAHWCYDAALSFIRNTDYATYTHALVCHERAKSSINSNLGFIDDLVSTGRRLWPVLDNIFPNCYDSTSGISDILKLRNCINDQIEICNVDVNKLKRDVHSAEHTAKTAFDNIIQESDKCLNDAYSASQLHITEAKEIFTRCLKTSCNKPFVVANQ